MKERNREIIIFAGHDVKAHNLQVISQDTADLIYGAPSAVFGVKPIATGVAKVGQAAVKEAVEFGNATKYVVGELGKDVKASGDFINKVTSGIPHNKYVFSITDRIGQGIESIENITPKQYIFGGSVGYLASSGAQYITNGNIDHSKSLKVGLATPYTLYISPWVSLSLGSFTTIVDTKLSNENTYLRDQAKYLKNAVISEGSSNYLPKQLEPIKPIINTITNEILNESEGK